VLDRDGLLVDANPSAMRILGLSESSIGRDLLGGGRARSRPSVAPEFREAIGSLIPRDLRIDSGQGARSYRVESSNLARGTLVVVTDQTEFRDLLARIETLAMKDELTGLPNRRSFLAEGAASLRAPAGEASPSRRP